MVPRAAFTHFLGFVIVVARAVGTDAVSTAMYDARMLDQAAVTSLRDVCRSTVTRSVGVR